MLPLQTFPGMTVSLKAATEEDATLSFLLLSSSSPPTYSFLPPFFAVVEMGEEEFGE
jgi:hypothetical protein